MEELKLPLREATLRKIVGFDMLNTSFLQAFEDGPDRGV
jgi:hypothetical protein